MDNIPLIFDINLFLSYLYLSIYIILKDYTHFKTTENSCKRGCCKTVREYKFVSILQISKEAIIDIILYGSTGLCNNPLVTLKLLTFII